MKGNFLNVFNSVDIRTLHCGNYNCCPKPTETILPYVKITNPAEMHIFLYHYFHNKIYFELTNRYLITFDVFRDEKDFFQKNLVKFCK